MPILSAFERFFIVVFRPWLLSQSSTLRLSYFILFSLMANFKTHVGIALGASSLLATMSVNAGFINAAQSPWYVSLGLVGGMLPDIDASNSRPAKQLFTGLSLWCSSSVWLALEQSLEQRPLLMTTLTVFFTVRYLAAYAFQRVTVHRGVFHSLLAGVFFALLLTCVSHYGFKVPTLTAWLGGVFLLFGFFVHLCLDELFSVDLANGRMKKSFGTALKLYGYQNIPGSLLLLILSSGLFLAAPSSAPVYKAWRSSDWSRATDLLPQLNRLLRHAVT